MYFKFLKFFILLNLLTLLTSCNETLLHNLSENDANKILSGLHKQLITADKIKQTDGFWSVTVSKEDSYKALEYIANARIIKSKPINSDSKSSLISSREDKLFQFERALSNEIEYTLKSLPGTLDVRVHLNLPIKDPLFGQDLSKDNQGSASVLLISSKDFQSSKKEVKKLVGGASGIKVDSISVLIQVNNLNLEEASKTKIAISKKNIISKTNFLKKYNFQILSSLLIIIGFLIFIKIKQRKNKLSSLKSLHSTKEARING